MTILYLFDDDNDLQRRPTMTTHPAQAHTIKSQSHHSIIHKGGHKTDGGIAPGRGVGIDSNSLVVRHYDTIHRFSQVQWGRVKWLDRDEIIQDVLLRVLERGGSFDPKKASYTTWVWWQIRSVIQDHIRRQKKSMCCDEISETIESKTETCTSIENRATVAQLFLLASPGERQAMQSILLGVRVADLPATMGFTAMTRSRRLRSVRDRVTAT